jgi:hypothetical protein
VHYINTHREMCGQINSKYINCKGEIKAGVRLGVGVGSGVGVNVDDTAGGTDVNLDKFLKTSWQGTKKKDLLQKRLSIIGSRRGGLDCLWLPKGIRSETKRHETHVINVDIYCPANSL